MHEDSTTLTGFREGHAGVLEYVYLKYSTSIAGYARALARRSRRSELAQSAVISDIVHETFVRAFRPEVRLRYDGKRDYGIYLRTVARNCFIDAVRAASRHELRAPHEFSMSDPQDDGENELETSSQQLQLITERYVRSLPAELGQIYQQRFVLDLSQDATSRALSISRRRVRTGEARLCTGLRKAVLMDALGAGR